MLDARYWILDAAAVSPPVVGAFLATDFLVLMRLTFTLSFRGDKSNLNATEFGESGRAR
jgi:hypothetical protein